MGYLERYTSGEYREVWDELVALDDKVQDDPLRDDAWAVATETMSRVQQNMKLLVPRLREMGYRFGDLPDAPKYWRVPPIHKEPSLLAGRAIKKLETKVGTLPLSLKAFWSTVGNINLLGYHPDWLDTHSADPLCVDPVGGQYSQAYLEEYEGWSDSVGVEDRENEPFILPLSPDAFHKANISGGEPYGIQLPCNRADAIWQNERHNTTFVNYLRLSFERGGFPGLEALPPQERPTEKLAFLTRNLIPF